MRRLPRPSARTALMVFEDKVPVRLQDVAAGYEQIICRRICMPGDRSTFTKRQKELTRQQRQKDKAERRNQRRQEKPAGDSGYGMAELHEHAAAHAALFNVSVKETETAEESTPGGGIGE